MKLHTLPKVKTVGHKRLGQGYGSGKGGHTSSRGQKGQKARGKIPAHFIGTSWVWFKRLPFIRGKSRFGALGNTYTVTFTELNRLAAGSIVNRESLMKAGILPKNISSKDVIKVVNSGKLEKKLTVAIPASRTAAKLIEKAGGVSRVENS